MSQVIYPLECGDISLIYPSPHTYPILFSVRYIPFGKGIYPRSGIYPILLSVGYIPFGKGYIPLRGYYPRIYPRIYPRGYILFWGGISPKGDISADISSRGIYPPKKRYILGDISADKIEDNIRVKYPRGRSISADISADTNVV
jgi:hypothetical protein